jgi:hypothetical protein
MNQAFLIFPGLLRTHILEDMSCIRMISKKREKKEKEKENGNKK